MRMYKPLIIASFFIFILIFFYFWYFSPQKQIERIFNINIEASGLELLNKEEKWDINGDGDKLLIYNYEKINLESFGPLKQLPIQEELEVNGLPSQYKNLKVGYYKVILDDFDNRDMDILIVDPSNKKIIVYVQIM
ncbi:hypothetical protein KRX57_08310 [Weeksellaceae bacterium TAE3-ERU29]|nr:hypothetical protein [Weeksellaceae bacterium TAE3-ERU29]